MTKFKITDLPKGLLALMNDDGSIIINAKHLEKLDELLHDRDGLLSGKALPGYYYAQQEYHEKYSASEVC